jgi:hypothetical protein
VVGSVALWRPISAARRFYRNFFHPHRSPAFHPGVDRPITGAKCGFLETRDVALRSEHLNEGFSVIQREILQNGKDLRL